MAQIKINNWSILILRPILNFEGFFIDASFGFFKKRRETLSEREFKKAPDLNLCCESGPFSVNGKRRYLGIYFYAHRIKLANKKQDKSKSVFEVAIVLDSKVKKMRFDHTLFIRSIHFAIEHSAKKILTAVKDIANKNVKMTMDVCKQINRLATLMVESDHGNQIRTNERLLRLLVTLRHQLIEHRPCVLRSLSTTPILCSTEQNRPVTK